MEINGVAHTFVTVGDMARSRAFYSKLLPYFGLVPVLDAPDFYYCVGGRTAFGLRPAGPEYRADRFVQARVGLHHICFRARTREEVDELHAKLIEWGAKVVHKPEEGAWAPGYYSVLFEDPDGIRLELNFVPGKGLLTDRKPA